MIYPNFNMNEIKESVEFYNSSTKFRDSVSVKEFGLTIESWIKRLEERSAPDKDDRIIKSLIIMRDNPELLTDRALEVVNKILGDMKLRKKFRIVWDGSYLNNRIWANLHIQSNKLDLAVNVDSCVFKNGFSDLEKFYDMPIKKQIDWVYNHFECIYIQIFLVKDQFDLFMHIADLIESEELDRMFSESLEDYYPDDYQDDDGE